MERRPASEVAGASAGDRWEHFAHGADIGVRGTGATRERALEQVALALTAVVTDPATVQPAAVVPITCAAADDDALVAAWLNALIYEMAIRRMLFGGFSVTLDGTRLSAVARGEPVDRVRHEPAVEVKGATYTALAFRRLPDGRWLAQCVVDV
jgi:tRNA nucleotidyltransferase (CCA-adding enzyme)